MNILLILIFLLVGQILIYSCHIPHDKEIICEQNFIVNRSMQYDSIKAAVVDLKIVLLITLRKFEEGAKF